MKLKFREFEIFWEFLPKIRDDTSNFQEDFYLHMVLLKEQLLELTPPIICLQFRTQDQLSNCVLAQYTMYMENYSEIMLFLSQIYGAAVADNLDRNRGVLNRRYVRQVWMFMLPYCLFLSSDFLITCCINTSVEGAMA